MRRSVEALARGDLDAFLEAHDPEVEWRTAADEPNPVTYRGFDDVMVFEGFIDLGDWVVVPWAARLRGRRSGIPVDVKETYAVRVEDGRIVRVDEYRTKEEAIEAVRRR